MTWKQLTERDCREWKLSAINPCDVRSAMHAASQLPGRVVKMVDICKCTFEHNIIISSKTYKVLVH